jgi:crotonobetainyl-CoA:carnitine CoA-transferase CaiB-like acyl-CoA transferase
LAAPLLLRLLAQADVFITDRSEDELRELGLGAVLDQPWAENPGLVVADVTVWGALGPWAGRPGSELAVQAMAGYTRYLGSSSETPRRLGADVAGTGAAMFTVQAVLAALLWRRRGGTGQRVSTSMLNALVSMKSIHLAAQSDPDRYAGPRVGGPYDPPERGWRTGDRPIFFAFGGSVGAEGRPGWTHFIEEVGLTAQLSGKGLDPTGRDCTGFGSRMHEMRPIYEAAFAAFTAGDLVQRIRKYGAIAAPYMHAGETMADPQITALGIMREVPCDLAGGTAKVTAFPARFSRSRPEHRGIAPRFAEHGGALAAACGFSTAEVAALQEQGGLALPG